MLPIFFILIFSEEKCPDFSFESYTSIFVKHVDEQANFNKKKESILVSQKFGKKGICGVLLLSNVFLRQRMAKL